MTADKEKIDNRTDYSLVAPSNLSGPALYVVATPIGNLADMVPRAVEVLQQVDLIAAEDTRHSAPLLKHYNIITPTVAYHEHSSQNQAEFILAKLREGCRVALISDAGTPLISDPGYRLVRAAGDNGIPIIPVPGASALVAALSCAGLPSDRFIFEGFLPAKEVAMRKRLQMFVSENRTLIFYEAPHRVLATVRMMVDVFGPNRECVLARELTKLYETIRRADLATMQRYLEDDSNQQRGEIVLLLAGAPKTDGGLTAEAIKVLEILAAELPPNQASALAAKITGVKRKLLYKFLHEQKPGR